MQLLKIVSLLSIVFLALAPSCRATLVIGGFNSDRVGIGNVVDGVITEDIRALVSTAWSDATFVGTSLLSTSFLNTVDVLLIGAPKIGGVTYLSSEEQQNLFAYIKAGGGAIIFADNDDHAGVPMSDDAAETFLNPFGVDVTGHLDDLLLAHPMSNAAPHPIMVGPFGPVESIATYHSGWFDGFGTEAERVAEYSDSGKAAVLAIARGKLGPGSGGVVFLNDADMLVDSAEGGYIGTSDNTTLILNSVAYVIPEPSVVSLCFVGIGSFFAARRRRGAARC